MRKYKSEWTNFKEVPNRIGLGLWCYVFFKMLLSISISLKSILLMLILISIFFRQHHSPPKITTQNLLNLRQMITDLFTGVMVLIINILLRRVEFGIWLSNTTANSKFKIFLWCLSQIPNSTLRRRMFIPKFLLDIDMFQNFLVDVDRDSDFFSY